MSRIGRRPISVPNGVQVEYKDRQISLKGPKGQNIFNVPELVELQVGSDLIEVVADYKNDKAARCMMGTVQSVLQNMVTGVAEGFIRRLNLVGVGYKAQVQGKSMELNLGFSKPILYPLPEGIGAKVEGTTIELSSHDNVLLGQTAAKIRSFRPPEPYQGKGVLYENERVRRKAGKSGKK